MSDDTRASLLWLVMFVGFAVMTWVTYARGEPLERPRDLDPYRDIRPPVVACPDQQTIDEMTAMRRLGDREGDGAAVFCD